MRFHSNKDKNPLPEISATFLLFMFLKERLVLKVSNSLNWQQESMLSSSKSLVSPPHLRILRFRTLLTLVMSSSPYGSRVLHILMVLSQVMNQSCFLVSFIE
ncbi:hypothetical protein K1719_043912 [Acacia pycnantha]|nr:hypothetical protein K1719_043912 [Acacia pycnantha]